MQMSDKQILKLMSKEAPQGRPIFNQKEFSIEYDKKYENGIK